MSSDRRLDAAKLLYERAVFGGDKGALATAERELTAVDADLALARGRILHARFLEQRSEDGAHQEDPQELALFEQAVRLYQALGDVHGEAEALFWVGTFHQIVQGDNGTAVPTLERANELASEVGDLLTMSYAIRHLAIAEHMGGHLASARDLLEESTRLRRELGFMPGVAANLIGLAYVAADEGRRGDALALVEEADAIAEASGAHGIMRSIEQARSDLGST